VVARALAAEVAPAAEVAEAAHRAEAATRAEAAPKTRAADPPATALMAAPRARWPAAATASPDLLSYAKLLRLVVSDAYGSNVTGISTMWSGSPFSALDSNTWIEPRCFWSVRNRTLVR
jgi:hypothetical protein